MFSMVACVNDAEGPTWLRSGYVPAFGRARGGLLPVVAAQRAHQELELCGRHLVRGHRPADAQLDLAPFGGRLRPVAFVDVGQADRPGDLFSSTALAGAGVGVSIFHGALRFDLSHPLTPDTGGKVRFDIVVQAVR